MALKQGQRTEQVARALFYLSLIAISAVGILIVAMSFA